VFILGFLRGKGSATPQAIVSAYIAAYITRTAKVIAITGMKRDGRNGEVHFFLMQMIGKVGEAFKLCHV
jgi:hypothetical protein